jgi:hypothetical protein
MRVIGRKKMHTRLIGQTQAAEKKGRFMAPPSMNRPKKGGDFMGAVVRQRIEGKGKPYR